MKTPVENVVREGQASEFVGKDRKGVVTADWPNDPMLLFWVASLFYGL